MTDPIRRFVSLLLLVATLGSLPGSSSACACGSRRAAGMSRGCPRCAESAAKAAMPRLTRANCCKAKVSDADAALTPATPQLDRASVVAMALPAATHGLATGPAETLAARGPPGLDVSAPFDARRSSILRL